MSSLKGKKTAGKRGRSRRQDLVTAEAVESQSTTPADLIQEPTSQGEVKEVTYSQGKTGRNNLGKRRALTQNEANPWEFDETTKNIPRILSNDWAQIMLGDCHELLKRIPDASVSLLYTDPPFSITMAKWDEVTLQILFLLFYDKFIA